MAKSVTLVRGSGRVMRPGVLAFWISRISAIALLFLVPLKIYTGYVSTGKLPGPAALGSAHTAVPLDVLLLFCVLAHGALGVRVLLLEWGWFRSGEQLFWIVSGIAIALFLTVVVLVTR